MIDISINKNTYFYKLFLRKSIQFKINFKFKNNKQQANFHLILKIVRIYFQLNV